MNQLDQLGMRISHIDSAFDHCPSKPFPAHAKRWRNKAC